MPSPKSLNIIFFTPVIALLLMLSSCFTGVESTPKITSRDVRRVEVGATSEAAFAHLLTPDRPSQWPLGRRFVVTDSRLSRLLVKERAVEPGDIIAYAGASETGTITGDTVAVLHFLRNATDTLDYQTNIPPLRLAADSTFAMPFIIDLDLVARADSLLGGKCFYLMTSLRVDSLARPASNSRRYIPVDVTHVYPGNSNYPLRVEFVDDLGETASVVMTAGSEHSATRNFNRIFSFSNPRDRYPQITDEIWQLIVNSSVKPGMTLEECRLAVGTPRDVRKGHNGTSYFEQWTFDNGAYLIFEDGLLKTFRL